MKDFNPFNELVWLIMSCILLALILTMFIGQLILAGGWQWWAWFLLLMVANGIAMVVFAYQEYKQSKQ